MREGNGAAAAAGLGHRCGGRVDALTVREHRIAESQHSVVRAGLPIGAKRQTLGTLTLEATLRVGALSPETRIAGAFVDVLTSFTIWSQLIAGVTDTFEGPLNVDAFTIVTHSSLTAFVEVPAESSISRVDIPSLAHTHIGAESVLTLTSETDQRVLKTLINVNTGEAGAGEFEPGQTLAVEGPVHVGTFPV